MADRIDMWEIENSLYANGYKVICGVDEADRKSVV